MAQHLKQETLMHEALGKIKTIALVGASSKPERSSYEVMSFLLGEGYNVIPVNPGLARQKILGRLVVSNLADIKEPIDMVEVFRNSDAVPEILEQALDLSPLPKLFWMQRGVVSEESAKRAIDAGIDVVMDHCPHMILGQRT